jgi:hypothetical protein
MLSPSVRHPFSWRPPIPVDAAGSFPAKDAVRGSLRIRSDPGASVTLDISPDFSSSPQELLIVPRDGSALTASLTPSADMPASLTHNGRAGPHTNDSTVGQKLRLTAVIPTLNEADNLAFLLPQLKRFDEVIIVDGRSQDGTVDVARRMRPDVRVLERPPLGKGDALRAGFAAASCDVIVMMDADGSMDPREVDAFAALIDIGYDVVKGSRTACGGGSHDLTLVRFLGNKMLCWVGNRLYSTAWTDLCYGYMALRRSCIPLLTLHGTGFEIEAEILVRAAVAKLRMAELPSIEMPRRFGDSHLNAMRDGTRVLRTMLGVRFAPRSRRAAQSLRAIPD